MVPLSHYLYLSAILFFIGVFGVLWRRNLIVILMSIELMLNSVNLSFIAFSRFTNVMDGHVFAFFIMAVAAAEAGIGLAILVMIFRNRRTVQADDLTLMRD
ncbi:MAG: NADH-quinone oxidoreductase subunit NuoK [Candidatus Latescibacterota bacterium]